MFTLSSSCWPTLIIWSFFFHNNTKPSNLHIGILFVFHKRLLFITYLSTIHGSLAVFPEFTIYNVIEIRKSFFWLKNSVSGTVNSSFIVFSSWWLAMLIFTRIYTIVLKPLPIVFNQIVLHIKTQCHFLQT